MTAPTDHRNDELATIADRRASIEREIASYQRGLADPRTSDGDRGYYRRVLRNARARARRWRIRHHDEERRQYGHSLIPR